MCVCFGSPLHTQNVSVWVCTSIPTHIPETEMALSVITPTLPLCAVLRIASVLWPDGQCHPHLMWHTVNTKLASERGGVPGTNPREEERNYILAWRYFIMICIYKDFIQIWLLINDIHVYCKIRLVCYCILEGSVRYYTE